jgi:integrase
MLKTRSGLPKHCSWNEDRHGTRRCRFRKGGVSIYLNGTPWSPDFMLQYGKALDGAKPQTGNIGAGRTKPGSFDALVVSYYRSPEFTGLAPSTRTLRRNILERFRAEHGSKPVRGLARRHISEIIGAKANAPEGANHLLKALRVILAFAVDMNMIESNPAAGVKRYRSQGDGHHSWSDAEVEQFEAKHPIGSRARLALALGLYTAQRKGDVLRMGWQHVNGDSIVVKQAKTGVTLVIPMHPNLIEVLSSVPKTNLTFLVTEIGAPFSAAGFGNWFRRECDTAGLKHCSFHGLRKAAATKVADAGGTTDQVKAFTGHRSLREVARYTKAADQKRLARQALEVLLKTEGEQTLSNLVPRLDKTSGK